MADEERLSDVLSEFARTLATDFPIQAILDHLVERIVGVLPVTAAGVTLISAGRAPHYVAASDAAAMRFETLQGELGEGPCLLAYQSGRAVAIPDLSFEDRFPRFTPAALDAGLAAVFTFPLRYGRGRLGALDLYRDVAGELAERDMGAAQTLADVATAYLLNAQARELARATSDQFRHSALHDALTGLPNRLLLQERLDHAAQRARRTHSNAAILFVDLDRFKQVNDSYGHPVGDELLVAVGRRLSALVRPGDTLARFSGDEFVFLCEDLGAAADARALAARIENAFARPFVVTGLEIMAGASVGIAFAAPGEDISKRLLVRADMAMYQAKRRKRGPHQIVDLREKLDPSEDDRLEADLRTALMANRLDVAYQPVVRLTDGHMVGVEALLRWTHPARGAVPAASVVELAEHSELITLIGAWVLERSCRDRRRWLGKYPKSPIDVAVNVSVRQVAGTDFADTVARLLTETGMDPTALVLEVTENTLMEDTDHVMTVLSDLRQMGIRLALDDFGTGFSALSYLRRLPLDIVKIDQTFIADIGQSTTGGAIVAAVTNLAHVLGLSVTAEGVETLTQHEEVRGIGTEFGQGYFYGRPVPARTIDQLLAADLNLLSLATGGRKAAASA